MLLIPLSCEANGFGAQTEYSGSNGQLEGDKLGSMDAATSEL